MRKLEEYIGKYYHQCHHTEKTTKMMPAERDGGHALVTRTDPAMIVETLIVTKAAEARIKLTCFWQPLCLQSGPKGLPVALAQ